MQKKRQIFLIADFCTKKKAQKKTKFAQWACKLTDSHIVKHSVNLELFVFWLVGWLVGGGGVLKHTEARVHTGAQIMGQANTARPVPLFVVPPRNLHSLEPAAAAALT